MIGPNLNDQILALGVQPAQSQRHTNIVIETRWARFSDTVISAACRKALVDVLPLEPVIPMIGIWKRDRYHWAKSPKRECVLDPIIGKDTDGGIRLSSTTTPLAKAASQDG